MSAAIFQSWSTWSSSIWDFVVLRRPVGGRAQQDVEVTGNRDGFRLLDGFDADSRAPPPGLPAAAACRRAAFAAGLRLRTALATGATASSMSLAALSATLPAFDGASSALAAALLLSLRFRAAFPAGADGSGVSAGTGVPASSAAAKAAGSAKATVARWPSSVMVQPERPLTSQPALTSLAVAVVSVLWPRGMPPLSSSRS